MKDLETVTAEINALQATANEALEQIKSGSLDSEAVESLKTKIENEMQPQLNVLTEERQAALRDEEFKSMQGQLETLEGALKRLGQSQGEFTLGEEAEGDESDPYYKEGKAVRSIFADIRLANKNNTDALARLTQGFDGLNAEGKAMTEGTPAQGGYLVRPQVERQLVENKELDNVLRGLCSKLNVQTNEIQLDQLTLSTTAGWVAELAQKPETTAMTLATVSANVFTAAGLATVSNQLLADSDPAVDGLVTSDLSKRLTALEETAFISGTGSGQPLGILNTPGIGATSLTSTAVDALLLAILDAIAAVETNHGSPNAILMHPRTWTRILKAQTAGGVFLIEPGVNGIGANDYQQPRTGFRGPTKSLWGYPVILSNRVPTNLGGGTNESRVVVGDFSECLILDRQGITVDESPHVYFTTNQTVFRAEMRVGFTAARTPLAINVVGGTGLANG
jgi:HK97 family phage major capsid protein